jgi:hypothetical protein
MGFKFVHNRKTKGILSLKARISIAKKLKGNKNSLGIKRKKETCEKISKALTGKKLSMKTKNKIRKAINKYFENPKNREKCGKGGMGRIPWNKGLTKENNKKLQEVSHKNSIAILNKYKNDKGYRNRVIVATRKAMNTPEMINKMSILAVNQIKNHIGFSKTFGYRKDLKKYFRVRNEANYARYLKYNNILYEYESEKCIFKLSNGRRYICDFYLPETDEYIELKGYMRKDAEDKIKLFQKEYPNIKYKIIYENNKEWKNIILNFEHNIPGWEKRRRYSYV